MTETERLAIMNETRGILSQAANDLAEFTGAPAGWRNRLDWSVLRVTLEQIEQAKARVLLLQSNHEIGGTHDDRQSGESTETQSEETTEQSPRDAREGEGNG